MFGSDNIRPLVKHHVDDVFRIFQCAFQNVPIGFLALKTFDDVVAILESGADNLSYGYFRDERLIAYQLGRRRKLSDLGLDKSNHAWLTEGEEIFSGLGVAVDTKFTGGGVGVRLISTRRQALTHYGLPLYSGLIDIRNHPSVRAQLSCGHIFSALERDGLSLNYRTFLSRQDVPNHEATVIPVVCSDLDTQVAMFDAGFSVTALVKKKMLGFSKPRWGLIPMEYMIRPRQPSALRKIR